MSLQLRNDSLSDPDAHFIPQNNMALPNIEILHRLPGPPIPNLGQAAPAADPAAGAQTPGTPQLAQTPGGAPSQPATPGQAPGGGTEANDDDFEDFQDFQDARATGGVQPSDSFGDFTAASPVNA